MEVTGEYTGIRFKLSEDVMSVELNYQDIYTVGNLTRKHLLKINTPLDRYVIQDENGNFVCKRELGVIDGNFKKYRYIKVDDSKDN